MSRPSRRPDPLYLAAEFASFSAQAVEAWHPAHRGQPFVVIEQNPHSHATAVHACSAAVRNRGIRPGMPLPVAEKRRPGLIAVARNRTWEAEILESLRRLCCEWTPAFDIGPDGALLLDLTGTPASRALEPSPLVRAFQAAVRQKVGLPQTAVGLSQSRVVARLLARQARPEGVRCCAPGGEAGLLAAMDAALIPGLPPAVREALKKYGLLSIGQIQGLSREALADHFGAEGERLYGLSRGFDLKAERRAAPKVSARTVLDRDINEQEALLAKLTLTADRLCFELKKEALKADRVALTLAYTDRRSAQKTFALPQPTHDFMGVARHARAAFLTLYQRRVALRSMTLAVNRPRSDPGQLSLFTTPADDKQRRLGEAITAIRRKLDFSAITCAANAGGAP